MKLVVRAMAIPKPRKGRPLGFHLYPASSNEGTLGDPERVVWASIRHLCSREVAEGVAAVNHGKAARRDREAISRNLKLYVQQASEFYAAAATAKPNTAPLIYYYSFLNLAKALCELKRPNFHRQGECYKHGISWRPDPKRLVNPARETVALSTRGVWHVLWEAVMDRQCPARNPTKIFISHLFSFCPEVSVEYSAVAGGPLRLLDVEKPEIMVDDSSNQVWLRFSVKRSELTGFRVSGSSFLNLIKTNRSGYTEVKSENPALRDFESSNTVLPIKGDAWLPLRGDVLHLNMFAHPGRDQKLQYFIPLQAHLPLPMPQLMVSYTILFWLGSLVRYDPHSVDALMNSQYWMLIDGFMSQSRLWLLERFEWELYQAETTLWRAQ